MEPTFFNQSLIDINEIVEKDKITNSDIALTLIDLLLYTKDKYKCSSSTFGLKFFDSLKNDDIAGKIFKNYKSSTLKKYWGIMNNTNKTLFAETLYEYANFLDENQLSLFQIIETVKNYILSDSNDFKSFLKGALLKEKKKVKVVFKKLEKKKE